MSKYRKNQQPSAKTIDEAMHISKSIQKPNQTREQTKLIAQGIQKGIAEYKNQQKVKARERDKLKKKIVRKQQSNTTIEPSMHAEIKCKSQWLAWILLIITWLGMAIFFLLIP
jgi:hypothetical protein